MARRNTECAYKEIKSQFSRETKMLINTQDEPRKMINGEDEILKQWQKCIEELCMGQELDENIIEIVKKC